MSEGRALTNCIGNGVATMVIAKLQGERDDERFMAVLDNPSLADPDRIEDEPEPGADADEAGPLRAAAEPVPGARLIAASARAHRVREPEGAPMRRPLRRLPCGPRRRLAAPGRARVPTASSSTA